MLFNSINFSIFFPIVFLLYWFVTNKSLKLQNILLLASSYFFYACWDYRFLFLLIFSTLLDYSTGIKMYEAKSQKEKRTWFWISVFINLGFLGVFKYYNFFIGSFIDAVSLFGITPNLWTLNIILPVGISFYTFHGLSYVIDIYNDKIKPERNIIDYSVFVSYFPLLVAGPIERATHLLPQLKKERKFDYLKSVDGLRQILWGLFKKIVIADNCAENVNIIFGDYSNSSSSTLVAGAFLFTIQIYCDFSGYSDIAIGVSRLLGIDLMRNFNFPFFSRNIPEFWRRWHISLSSWTRDYIYIPLGGSKGNAFFRVRNTFILLTIVGFWHGANWTFILYGVMNAIYFLPILLSTKKVETTETIAQGKFIPTMKEFVQMTFTFLQIVFASILFRSVTIIDAYKYIKGVFTFSIFTPPENFPKFLLVIIVVFFFIEWFSRENQYGIEKIGLNWNKFLRWGFYICIAFTIFLFAGKQQEFIYFQF